MNHSLDPLGREERSRSDLKAQEDLLALKVLGEPHFLDRVPTLTVAHEEGSFNAPRDENTHSEDFMQDLAQEVQSRVLSELELILPELISSCLSDALAQADKEKRS
ncbi:MAG: hypothetical protein WCJ99_10090 [Betaproteobacteria bacterium]|jgi:hypothetical protein